MEILSGGTLSAAIGTKDCPEGSTWLSRARVRSWFPMEEAFRQAAGVASALAYMHDEAMPVRFLTALSRLHFITTQREQSRSCPFVQQRRQPFVKCIWP